MKRSFKLLLCIMAIAALLVSCELPMAPNDTHGHVFTDANTDTICDVCGNADGAATHGHDFVDANEDEVCDTCAAAAHEHTYATVWTYDETDHWHAATCDHSAVVADKAAHTPDTLGVCTVCNAKVGEPDVSTIDKAIELAVAQKGSVKSGVYGDLFYEFRDGYFYVKNLGSGVEYYYSANGDGVLGVIKTAEEAYPDVNATLDNLLGVQIEIAYTWTFYGAEDLVATLWEMANEENALAGDVISSVENGVYSFTFGLDNWGPYVTTVEFTLDDEAYFIDSVNIVINEYYYGNYTEDGEGKYVINDDAEIGSTYNVELEQFDKVDNSNPFTPDMFTVTDFKFLDEYDTELTKVVVQKGYSTVIYLGALAPDTITFEFIDVVVSDLDVYGYFNSTYNTLTIYADESLDNGEYTLTVTVANLTKTITVEVVDATVDEVLVGNAEVGMNEWDEFAALGFEEDDYISIYAGSNAYLGVVTFKGNGATVKAIDADGNEIVLEAATLEISTYYDLDLDTYVTVYAYDLSALAAGEYTVVCTSVDNQNVETVIDLEVKAPQTLEEAFANNYEYTVIVEEGMMQTVYEKLTVIFNVDTNASAPAYGYVTGDIKVVVSEITSGWWGEDEVEKSVVECYFNYENGAFSFVGRYGQAVDIGCILKFDEYNNLMIGVVSYEGMDSVAPADPTPAPAEQLPMESTQINAQDHTYEYTAASAGVLTITTGQAIMGDVTFSYTVNGGDSVSIALGATEEITLAAGDVVVITVVAVGYSSIDASFVAAQ